MRKLPIIMVSAAMLVTSVVPGFAASNYSSLQPGAAVIRVDDNWRFHHRDHFDHSDWRGDRDWHHRSHHGGNAAAIIGGLAAGAIIGGAIESQRHDYPVHRHYYYDDY